MSEKRAKAARRLARMTKPTKVSWWRRLLATFRAARYEVR